MNSFIESAGIDIADGERFSFVNGVIPDLTFEGSVSASSPQPFTIKVVIILERILTKVQQGRRFAPLLFLLKLSRSIRCKVRGRSFALRVESDALGLNGS